MARRRGAGDLLVPGAQPGLDRLKMEVAQEIGLLPPGAASPHAYDAALDRQKWEVAEELGLADRIRQVGWGEMRPGIAAPSAGAWAAAWAARGPADDRPGRTTAGRGGRPAHHRSKLVSRHPGR